MRVPCSCTLAFLPLLPLLFDPVPAAAAPLPIPGSTAVSTLRKEPGDGYCATLVHINNPINPPFIGASALSSAVSLLNQPQGQSTGSQVVHWSRLQNSQSVNIGDFIGPRSASFPFEQNFAARLRGYLSVDPADIPYDNALFASAGARMRVAGTTLFQFDSSQSPRWVQQVRYARTGLYPFEVVFYANGDFAVLEMTHAPENNLLLATPVGPVPAGPMGLNTREFDLIPQSLLYTARVGSTTTCVECSADSACDTGDYCAHDWPGGDGPDGTCQPCLTDDHCGQSCAACPSAQPVCSPNATCVACVIDESCPLGQTCQSNTCVVTPPCTVNSCTNGRTCDPFTGVCVVPCTDDTQCPVGLLCDPTTRACTQSCSTDAQCRGGESCDAQTGRCQAPRVHYGGGCSTTGRRDSGAPLAGLALLGLLGIALRRRRGTRTGGGLALGLLAASVLDPFGGSRALAADVSVNAQTFLPALGPENVITVEGSRTGQALRPMANLLFEYADRPLLLRRADGTVIASTLSSMDTLHLMAGMGLTRWLSLGFDLPVVVYQGFNAAGLLPGDTAAGQSSAGVGDFRLMAKVRLVDNQAGGFGVAFIPQATFPTGSGDRFRGNDSYVIEPRFALDYRTRGGSFLAANAGFAGRTWTQVVGGSEIDSQFTYGLGGHLAIHHGLGLLMEASGKVAIGEVAGGMRYTPVELHGGVRWAHRCGLSVMAGAGGGVVDAPGSPLWRAFASIGYLPVGREPAVPPHRQRRLVMTLDKSGSGTGVVRSSPGRIVCGRVCTEEYLPNTEVMLTANADGSSHFVGWSGPCSGTEPCVVSVREATRVGVEFAANEEARATLTIDKQGDGTGVVSGTPAGINCGKVCLMNPKLGQEITLRAKADEDSWFAGWEGPCTGTTPCVMVMGGASKLTARFNKRQVKRTEQGFVLPKPIHFATKKAEIQPDSFVLLDEIVANLQREPEIRLRIEGHTDDVPFNRPGGNMRLSQERAGAVVSYLSAHGISADRMTSEGYGETCPIASNKSDEGRTLNRRTEFWLVKAGEPQAKECQVKVRRRALP